MGKKVGYVRPSHVQLSSHADELTLNPLETQIPQARISGFLAVRLVTLNQP
jgi:hypothetical protein